MLTLICFLHHLAQLPSRFCQILSCPDRIRQNAEDSQPNPEHDQMPRPVEGNGAVQGYNSDPDVDNDEDTGTVFNRKIHALSSLEIPNTKIMFKIGN